MCINRQVTLLNYWWVGSFINHHRFLLGYEVFLEEELLIEGLVLLNQIIEPARVSALSMTQRGIFNGRTTLLLPVIIVVKNGGSLTVVVAVISPSLIVRRLLALVRVFSILECLTLGELCHMKVMIRDPGDLVCLLVIDGSAKTTSWVFLRQ
jgi:hypothetical protein